jgi:hypothetical protein
MVLAGDPVLWSQVREVADTHFKVPVASVNEIAASPAKNKAPRSPASSPAKAPAERRGEDVMRTLFPIPLPVHVTEMNQAKNDKRSCLHVVSGHVYIYGWYLAMYEALDEGCAQDILSLWQCCLTTTIHVRIGLTVTELSVLSIQQSENRKTMDTMPCMTCSDR